jgi:3-methylfumaryl-CoA hydratase
MSEPSADLAERYAHWIGRRTEREDVVTPRLLAEFRATFGEALAGDPVPPCFFWCLAPEIVGAGDLGGDGHPRLGLFLPDLPFERRMWAGGELAIHGAFAPGDTVTKTSVIESIAFKTGSTGPLCFVAVRHAYAVGARLVVDERQDIVYRQAGTRRPAAPARPAERTAAAFREVVTATPTMLFRYSAVTFNGHRIHYDAAYATGVEGHGGLVVHGPLQATLMLNLAARGAGRTPRRFAYRGLAPLHAGETFAVEADWTGETEMAVAVRADGGGATMAGTATF